MWHLYQSMFGTVRQSVTSKVLSNTFRMTHAVVASLPLMIINLVTLINILRVDGLEDYALDIHLLQEHMSEGETPVFNVCIRKCFHGRFFFVLQLTCTG